MRALKDETALRDASLQRRERGRIGKKSYALTISSHSCRRPLAWFKTDFTSNSLDVR